MDVEGVAGVGGEGDVDALEDVTAIDDAAGRSGESAASAMAVPELEATGNLEVDAALERLRVLSERPTGAHPDLYDGVHQRLQEVLAQIDHQDAGR